MPLERDQMSAQLSKYLLELAGSPEVTPLPPWAVGLLTREDWPSLQDLPKADLEGYYLLAFSPPSTLSPEINPSASGS